jgi:hypothetical protein
MREFTSAVVKEMDRQETKSLLNEKFVGYKMVTEDFKSPFASLKWWRKDTFSGGRSRARPLSYRPGESHESRAARKYFGSCSVGLHVCPSVEGLRAMEHTYFGWFRDHNVKRPTIKYVKVEFRGRDVVDFSTSDKLRLQWCRVIAEIDAEGNLIGEDQG